MTPTRFRACLAMIGWSTRGLATRMGIDVNRTRRWASGRYPVPRGVALRLEYLADAHEAAPPPETWLDQ